MSWLNQKILIAGGSGFIGFNLINHLLRSSHTVRATFYKNPKRSQLKTVEWMPADFTLMSDCRKAVAGVDIVFMCAAETSGAAVIAETPLKHVTPNIVMNAQILEAAHQAGVKKFIFISSSAAYPPTNDHPVKEEEMFHADPSEIYYSVGWMKRYSEILCKIYSEKIKNPMATVVVRPSNIYGPYDKFDFSTSHVTAALVRKVIERHDPIEVWGTGEDVRDLVYIDDFIEGLILSAKRPEPHFVVNIASGKGYSVKHILNALLKMDGYSQAEVRFDTSKPSTVPIRLVSNDFANKTLEFNPKISLEEGLRRTIEWYRKTYVLNGCEGSGKGSA